jgi:hypothetical protein
LGKRVAIAFGQSVRNTEYVKKQWTLRNAVDTGILTEFGSRAGLCEIASKRALDRDVLRNVFFAKYKEMTQPGQQRRRISLLFLLECVGQTHAAGASFGNNSFSDICYFGALLSDDDTPKKTAVSMPRALTDIYERWRIFYTQNYLAVALQSMLVTCVRVIRDRPGGMLHESLVQALNPPGLKARFRECFGLNLPKDFFTLSVRETLVVCGVKSKNGVFNALPIEAQFSERNLENLLVDTEANEPACLALATMLLYLVLVRYQRQIKPSFNNWYEQQVHNDLADISLPGVMRFLHREFGDDWFDRPNGEILSRILSRFIIRQHERMSYERGFGGSAPLFHVDGTTVIGTGTDYTDPQALNPRLGSALQILSDLGLITYDEEGGYRRTLEGDAWLVAELKTQEPS